MALNGLMQWKGWEMMCRIQTPSLVLTGERARYFPRKVFEKVSEAIPRAEVIDNGGSKHNVQLERH
ncbi:MAG: alpha/beta hydrolase [Chloroflexi bacterium]|nr:alpha/beta hydrolase [Chloroflexota bacterium]